MHRTDNEAEVAITPAVTLRAAALYLTRYGWIQGRYYARPAAPTLTPAACALGAIGMAAYGQPLDEPQLDRHPNWPDFIRAEYALREYLDLIPYRDDDPAESSVHEWNDAPGRTVGEVIAALNAAADAWDATHWGDAR
jgi:Ser/Thr protein kinase RdoA (MazF antagonist)